MTKVRSFVKIRIGVKRAKMSVFYILGTDKKIGKESSSFTFRPCDISFLKFSNSNQDFLNENFYYEIIEGDRFLRYDIRNIANFNNNENKKLFEMFLDFISTEIQKGNRVSIYKFWDANKYDIDENFICNVQELSIGDLFYRDNLFGLEFHTKYIFKD